jgi:hypothetical protein
MAGSWQGNGMVCVNQPIERERETPFPDLSVTVSRSPSKQTSHVPQQGPYAERCSFPEPSFTHCSEH